MEGWVCLGGWLRSETVYLPECSHSSHYYPGSMHSNCVGRDQRITATLNRHPTARWRHCDKRVYEWLVCCVWCAVPARIFELKNITRNEGLAATLVCRSHGDPAPEMKFRRIGSPYEFNRTNVCSSSVHYAHQLQLKWPYILKLRQVCREVGKHHKSAGRVSIGNSFLLI